MGGGGEGCGGNAGGGGGGGAGGAGGSTRLAPGQARWRAGAWQHGLRQLVGSRVRREKCGSCTAKQLPLIAAYSAELRGNITAAQAKFGNRDGHFLTSCAQHEETCRQYDWFSITIGQGQTMNSTFTKWYTEGGGVEGSSVIDVNWPGDDSCSKEAHGAC